LAAAVVATLAVAGAGVLAFVERSPIVIPDDPCAERPPLRTVDGVRLQPAAMQAFLAAERGAGTDIPVVWSFRSCRQQRIACKNICGNPEGCPGLCAPPGLSWHQLGAAIDTTEEALGDPAIVAALEANGWCQSVPVNDPGHFSFGGCH
jgi:D-alanyl-D-alanine carboxypeptidase